MQTTYDKANEADLYRDSAGLCERMGRPEEAEYWRTQLRSLYGQDTTQADYPTDPDGCGEDVYGDPIPDVDDQLSALGALD